MSTAARRSFALFAALALAAAAHATEVKVDEGALRKLAADEGAMAEAKKKYAQTCAACHGAQGQGTIGPNLTDDFWVSGSSPQAIADAIARGNPKKGMPAMAPLVGGPEGVKLLTAYLLTLQGKNLPGRGPEGSRAP